MTTTTRPTDAFGHDAERGELMLPKCAETGQVFWPPSASSPFITGGAVEWQPTDNTGQVCSWVVFRRAFVPAFEDRLPYAVVLVEIAANARVLAFSSKVDGIHSGQIVHLNNTYIIEGGSMSFEITFDSG